MLAPLPNALFSHCGGDDLGSSYGESSAPVDLGRFITAMFVVTGFALPIVLAHSDIIDTRACVMSITGGGCVTSYLVHIETDKDISHSLVYATIMAYSAAFSQEESDYD